MKRPRGNNRCGSSLQFENWRTLPGAFRTTYRKLRIAYPRLEPLIIFCSAVNAMNGTFCAEGLVYSSLLFEKYPFVRTMTEAVDTKAFRTGNVREERDVEDNGPQECQPSSTPKQYRQQLMSRFNLTSWCSYGGRNKLNAELENGWDQR